MRALVSVLLCLFLAACFPTKVSPFSDAEPVFPIPDNAVLFLEQKIEPGPNFNPVTMVGAAFNDGVRFVRDGATYRVEGLAESASLPKDAATMRIRFFSLPSLDDYYLAELSNQPANQPVTYLTVMAGIAGETVRIYLLNPANLPPELLEEFKSFSAGTAAPDQLKQQIVAISSRLFDLPDFRDPASNFEIEILDPRNDAKQIDVLRTAAGKNAQQQQQANAARLNKQKAKALLNAAKDKYSASDYAGAIADYTAGLKLDPDNKDILVGRARAYERTDQHELAYKDYDQLNALFPDDPEYLYEKGFRQFLEKDYLDAIETLTVVVNHPNASFRALRAQSYRAQSLAGLKRFDEAFADFALILKQSPNDFDVLQNMSETYEKMGDPDNAIAYLGKAIDDGVGAEDYEITIALRERARLLRGAGRHDEAVADFSAVIKRSEPGTNLTSYGNRGKSYIELGALQKALEDFTYAITHADNNWTRKDSLWSRGYAYILAENYEAAINDYSAYIALDDTSATAFNNRGYAYRKLGKNSLADADFARAEALKNK